MKKDLRDIRQEAVLLQACRDKKERLVQRLLEEGTDPNSMDESAVTALLIAAETRCVKIFKMLLDAGASPDIPDNHSRTASDLADLAATNGSKIFAQMIARKKGISASRQEAASALLSLRDSTKEITPEETPLESVNKVMSFLQGEIENFHKIDLTPYQANKVEELIQLIRANGFDVNSKSQKGFTALHFAARFGSAKHVTDLIELGADTNISNSEVKSVLQLAVERKSIKHIENVLTDSKLESSIITAAIPMAILCSFTQGLKMIFTDSRTIATFTPKVGEKINHATFDSWNSLAKQVKNPEEQKKIKDLIKGFVANITPKQGTKKKMTRPQISHPEQMEDSNPPEVVITVAQEADSTDPKDLFISYLARDEEFKSVSDAFVKEVRKIKTEAVAQEIPSFTSDLNPRAAEFVPTTKPESIISTNDQIAINLANPCAVGIIGTKYRR